MPFSLVAFRRLFCLRLLPAFVMHYRLVNSAVLATLITPFSDQMSGIFTFFISTVD